MKATTILTNGRIYTLDPNRPQASTIAISGNRILDIGDSNLVSTWLATGGQKIDLDGRCVIPGLVDAHVHFQSYSLGLQQVNLQDVATLESALARVAE